MKPNHFLNIDSELKKHLGHKATIVLGLSGGQDSMALLYLLMESQLKLKIYACHLNHCLRGNNSERDQEFVEKVCDENEIPLFTKRTDISRVAKGLKIGVEQAGRIARRRFFEKVCKKVKGKKILLAHHLDDQVETFFMRLLRGSSLKGLQSMSVNEGLYLRPLIKYSKKELMNFLITRKIEWVQDESNDLTDYTRNNIRKNLIPMMEKFNPNLNSTISNTLDLITKQNEHVYLHIESIQDSIVKQISDSEFVISIQNLLSLSDFEASEVFYRFFTNKLGPKDFLSYRNINDLVNMIKSKNASWELFLTKNIKIEKGYEFLFIKTQASKIYDLNLNISSEGVWTNNNLVVKIAKDNSDTNGEYLFFELQNINFPISVRNFQEGDRISIKGLKSPKKLHDIFIDNKIPKFIRRMLPIFEANGQIFHVHGVNLNTSFKLENYKKNSIGISVTCKTLDKLIENTIFN
jgi:tRNA(Ile)-lysidine synthase|tara:strand:- start:4827 stop:6218 length:1392 start_codon:yes stop_codon:yes gene_type:complete